MKVPRKLFAALRAANAPLARHKHVRVVSHSAGSAAVFVLHEEEGNLDRFSTVARVMAQDLLGGDPSLAPESWIARSPWLAFGAYAVAPTPESYIQQRFEPDLAVPPELPAHRHARALWSIDRREQAIHVLEQACRSSSNPLDYFHLGELLAIQLGRREGVPHLRRACELAPDVSQPFTSLGIALASMGDTAGAVSAFERAVAIDPDAVGAWANLAQSYRSANDHAGMRRAAARAQQLEPGEPLTSALLAGDSGETN